jgi:histidine triad (HIT) family protein
MPEQPSQQIPQQLSPEQIKALQEKIKRMSPEELKEFQKKQCIFCQIIAGKVQAKKIYEDDDVVAILDINPANPGHILIMPREHYSIMPQIPDDEIGHIFLVAKALSNTSLRALEVQGSNIIVANGVAAGQRAQHFMVHLIPRKENDGINFQIPQKTIPEEELQKIRKTLSESLGSKIREAEEKITPVPLMPKQKVVEAKIKEKTPSKRKKGVKKRAKATKKQAKKQKKMEVRENINLDDIARVLGTK